MAQFIKVVNTADLAPGTAKCVEVAGKKIALFNLRATSTPSTTRAWG